MEEKDDLRYYVLFETYTEGMALQELFRKLNIKSRIAPAPRSIQGELGCGISILLTPDVVREAKKAIEEHNMSYYDVVPLRGQIKPNRNKFC